MSLPVTSWTAVDLMAAEFPQPKWAVPGLIVEGVTLLAGPPKAGKSWLGLDLSVSVASGGKALGWVDAEPGEVLYLALEDTGRRLQDRMKTVLHGDDPPKGLVLATECPLMNQGGLDLIRRWIDQQTNPRLIIVDVFERIRGLTNPGESAYTGDYSAVRGIKTLADERHVAIVLVHHVRKVISTDFINEISGTLGLAGAADSIAVLRRTRGDVDGQLLITGRDVEENEYAVRFAPELGAWQLLGLASEHGLSDTRQKILAFVREHDGARPKEISLGTGLDYELVKKTCYRMSDGGQLDTDNRGRYFPPAPPAPSPPP